MILKELRGYKMLFLRTNKKWKKLGVVAYASNASTRGGKKRIVNRRTF